MTTMASKMSLRVRRRREPTSTKDCALALADLDQYVETIHPEEVRTGLSNTILTMRGYVAGREGLPKVAFELLNAVEGLVYYILSNLEGTVRDADDMEYCMKRISAFLRMLDELQNGNEDIVVSK